MNRRSKIALLSFLTLLGCGRPGADDPAPPNAPPVGPTLEDRARGESCAISARTAGEASLARAVAMTADETLREEERARAASAVKFASQRVEGAAHLCEDVIAPPR